MRAVLETLNAISNSRGKKKLAIISEMKDDQEFLAVAKSAIDPERVYNVGKKILQEVEANGSLGDVDITLDQVQTLISQLETRALSGNAAKAALLNFRECYSEASWEVLKRILTKDLKIGVGASGFNEVIPGFVFVFAVNLAEPYEAKRVKKWPIKGEIKYDGVRVVAEIDYPKRAVRFLSRTGNEFTSFDHLKGPALQLIEDAMGKNSMARIIIDGEVVSGAFNKTVSQVRKKNKSATDAVFMAFEVLTFEEFYGTCTKIEEDRRRRAEAFFSKSTVSPNRAKFILIEQELLHSHDEVMAAFHRNRALGYEGLIAKQTDYCYENDRTFGFMKLKAKETEDAEIIDVYQGEPDSEIKDLAGGVIVRRSNGVAARVGGGWSIEQRAQIWADFTNTTVSYKALDKETDEFVMVVVEPAPSECVIGRIIEVEYHEDTPDGSYRHSRFKRFRDTVKKGSKE